MTLRANDKRVGGAPSGLLRDVIAGVSVAALLVPESLGYAGVAGLPPEVDIAAPVRELAAEDLASVATRLQPAQGSNAILHGAVVTTPGLEQLGRLQDQQPGGASPAPTTVQTLLP